MTATIAPVGAPADPALSGGAALRREARLRARLHATRALAASLWDSGSFATARMMDALADETEELLDRLDYTGGRHCSACGDAVVPDRHTRLLRSRCRACRAAAAPVPAATSLVASA